MSSTILVHPNPLLRQVATPVPPALFGTPALQSMIARMEQALAEEHNGIGLAATQIGLSHRIILVELPREGVVAFLNPEILQSSKDTILFEEGCLSVPGVFGLVRRKRAVEVRAYTPQGTERIMKWKDLYAVVFQHEIDHLNGILFVDKIEQSTNGSDVRV